MKHTKRIIIYTTVLIGGTLAFGFWAINGFNNAFSDFEKTNYTKYSLNDMEIVKNNTLTASTTTSQVSTTTATLASSTIEQLTDISKKHGFVFLFPKKDSTLYTGCKYKVSWVSPDIASMNLTLIDAGSKKPLTAPTGIPKDLTGDSLDYFNWKVKSIWPGKYYISASNINNVNWEERTPTFNISDIPENTKDIDNICNQ